MLGLLFPPTIIPDDLEFEIVPGHFLRAPSLEEREVCFWALDRFCRPGLTDRFRLRFRKEVWQQDLPTSTDLISVVERRHGYGDHLEGGFDAISNAASLLELSHYPTFPIVVYPPSGFSGRSELDDSMHVEPWIPKDDDLESIRDWHSKVASLSTTQGRVKRSLELYETIQRRNIPGVFKFVLLMSVVESLLVHTSSGRDDSVSRQIQLKVPFVLKREGFTESPFDLPPQDVWKQLYRLRSAAAHGEAIDFKASAYKSLRNIGPANDYLAKSLRSLLRFAITDPELVEDLAGI